LLRRDLLEKMMAFAVAGLVGGVRGSRAAASPDKAVAACSTEIVVHKGWVLRRSDLCAEVTPTPFSADAA